MNTSPTILFFGTENFSLITLEKLVTAGFSIGAIITKPDFKSGRGQKLTAPAVKTFALEHNIPVWQPTTLGDIASDIKQFDRPAGVLVSYGKIIPTSIIELFTPGIINLHPSLLPNYRGPSPIESAIANRDQTTGISIMQLEARMDAGPVYHQAEIGLNGSETQPQLYQTLGELGANQMATILPDILSSQRASAPQDESRASYCSLLTKSDAFFDPSLVSADALEAKVRAHLEFPGTKFVFNNHTLIIKHAHVADGPKTPLDQRCQDGQWLVIDDIQAPSGKTMNVDDFLRGYTA